MTFKTLMLNMPAKVSIQIFTMCIWNCLAFTDPAIILHKYTVTSNRLEVWIANWIY
jgi:hypothetical protein